MSWFFYIGMAVSCFCAAGIAVEWYWKEHP